jgi:uncharacterized protein YbbC (DUF1343 family)
MDVTLGLDVLLHERLDLLSGKRVGLLAHPASVNRDRRHIVDLLTERPEVRTTALFGPQHGARGETQDNMIEWEDYRDPQLGVPVYSLYGTTRKPTREMLADLDVLVIDLQDVGSRYYTFIYTMALAMEACAEQGKTVVVLDRPNPINGVSIEGPILDPHFSSFVGLYPIPVRHGMTPGELALMFNQEFGIGVELTVVPMQGWQRKQHFDETGLPWVMPSPNMPNLNAALVYPGMCLLEGTNVSEGRGTTAPFEFSGAPWIDSEDFAARLSGRNLPGVFFRPLHFLPTFHKWAGHLVGGVQVHVTERESFRPFLTGILLIEAYRERGQELFQWKQPPYEYEYELLPFDILCGTDQIRKTMESGRSLMELADSWVSEVERFRHLREPFLLY